MPDTTLDKAALRTELRLRRKTLSSIEQQAAAEAVADSASRLPNWKNSGSLALYLAADGEIGTAGLEKLARNQGKALYIPVIHEDDSLGFALWEPDSELFPNRYGIPEPPSTATVCKPANLDLIFLPLVGWDRTGGRLGMGGGFYDRSLEKVTGTTLVGLAHSCQEIVQVPQEEWDVRLDYVATETALLQCRG